MALRQSVGSVIRWVSGGTSQPGGVVSSPHVMAQDPRGVLMGIGVEMLVLRRGAGRIRGLMLPAGEDTERPAGLGGEASITRFGGRARVPTKRMQPMPNVASECTIALLSDDVRWPSSQCEEKVRVIVLLRQEIGRQRMIRLRHIQVG